MWNTETVKRDDSIERVRPSELVRAVSTPPEMVFLAEAFLRRVGDTPKLRRDIRRAYGYPATWSLDTQNVAGYLKRLNVNRNLSGDAARELEEDAQTLVSELLHSQAENPNSNPLDAERLFKAFVRLQSHSFSRMAAANYDEGNKDPVAVMLRSHPPVTAPDEHPHP